MPFKMLADSIIKVAARGKLVKAEAGLETDAVSPRAEDSPAGL